MPRRNKDIDRIDKIIGRRIHEARRILGLTADTVAASMDISYQQFYKYEKALNRVPASRLPILSKLLQKPVSYFIDELKATELEPHHRLKLTVAQQLMMINNPAHLRAINNLVKALLKGEKS